MFHFGDFSSEALQHRFHHWIAFKLRAQLLRGRTRARSRCGRRCNCFEFSTDSHGATEHLARSDTELLERLASFEHFREGPLVRGKINSQFGAFELPAGTVLDEFTEKFLLRLDGLLDFGDLFVRDALVWAGIGAAACGCTLCEGSCIRALFCSGAGSRSSALGRAIGAGSLAGTLEAVAVGAGAADISRRGSAGIAGAAVVVRELAVPAALVGAPLRTSASNSSNGASRDALINRS